MISEVIRNAEDSQRDRNMISKLYEMLNIPNEIDMISKLYEMLKIRSEIEI
jgi:hypothetical protein